MARRLLCLLFLVAYGCLAQAQNTCGPSLLGEPCGQGGIAVQAGNEPSINLGAGNPIHLATGNKYQQELDLPSSAQIPRLEIRRHYNALDTRSSVLGQGWNLSYDTRLFIGFGRWQIVQADGSRITFAGIDGKPEKNSSGTLSQQKNGQWLWIWPNGQKLHFDRHGLLVQITFEPAESFNIVRITRNSDAGPLLNTISKITNAAGRSLELDYLLTHGQAYIKSINSPFGLFQYAYEPAASQADPKTPSNPLRLRSVTRPDGMQRRYLYEAERQAGNPFHLTGIEITSADRRHTQRINTWAYDNKGRAILSIQGPPESVLGKVAIDYVRAPSPKQEGLTQVSNASGQVSRFHTAIRGGRYVLLRATGAPCPGCAAPGSQAQYDSIGRLKSVNGTQIDRYLSGRIKQLTPKQFGWPALTLSYQSSGNRYAWHSALTGTEHTVYNSGNLPLRRLFSNEDRWDFHYDRAGRPVRITAKNSRQTEETALHWQGNLLTLIDHPHEKERRQYDALGRLSQRTITRPAHRENFPIAYSERFDYDDRNRLVKHHLPEGGRLQYQWGKHNQIERIDWYDAQGVAHRVIHSQPQQTGYTYGNGLRLETTLSGGQASQLQVHGKQEPIWTQRHHYDQHGRLQQETHAMAPARHAETWRYAYDTNSRLIGADSVSTADPSPAASPRHAWWYAWQEGGSLAALKTNGETIKPHIQRDKSGLPTALQGYTLSYGPNRRLTGITRDGHRIDTYRHNAFGHRISTHTPRATTHYFYFGNQVVAESRLPSNTAGGPSAAITRRYIYAQHTLVGLIDYAAPGTQGILYAVHSDLAGAPRLVTDNQQKIRWLASYSPTGAATPISGDLTLNLRLPGQVFDQTTGWHDNLLRTYLPQSGHYLEPDPLGPVPGGQALGYADQQPKRYIDPLGLLLFAFDGTRNSPETQTNVWKMSQLYQDGPVFYHSGPGNPHYTDWDAITAHNAPQIIEDQWQSLLNTLNQPAAPADVIPIDIIGFSRGAALARHFGNLINQHVDRGFFSYPDPVRGLITACIDLRFMGLFDTVAQFGLGGAMNSNYDLTIAAAWGWVAHAVALHERRWLFPLSSISGSGSVNTVEAPFIGAHADIGGGVAYSEQDSADSGDLPDVAFNWMLWQARAASLQFDQADSAQREVTDPLLHDNRVPPARSIQNGDRRIDTPSGSILYTYQDEHARLGAAQRGATEALITRYDNWRRNNSSEVGKVDMDGYAQWLQNEVGWQPLPL